MLLSITNRIGFFPSRASCSRYSPALDASGQICLIPNARHVGGLFADAGGDALHRTLDDVVDDRLLQRVVEDRPGEQATLVVPRRRREVELRGDVPEDVSVQPSDDLAPLAFLVVQVWASSLITTLALRAPPADAPKSSKVPSTGRGFRTARAAAISSWPRARQDLPSQPRIELLDVREIERTLRAGPLWVAAHVAVEVPEDP